MNDRNISPSDRKVNCQADFDYIGLRKWVLGLDSKNQLFDNGLSAFQRLVLLVLVEHLPNVAPSISRMANLTKMSKRTVMRVLQSLEDFELLQIHRENGVRSNYILKLDRCHTVTSATQSPVPHSHPTGDTQSPPPVTHSHPKQTSEAGSKAERAYLAQKTASKSKKPSSRAAPLPDAWHPTEKHRDLARQRGVDIDLAADKFRAHAESVGRTQKNWNASFRLWLLNEKPSDQTVPPAPMKYGMH